MPRTLLVVIGLTFLATGILGAESKLNNPKRLLKWSGSVAKASGPIGEVPECTPGCQRFDLTVNLPVGIWKNHPGGVQIAIRWVGLTSAMPPGASFARAGRPSTESPASSDNLGDNLKLYVYRGGSAIAKSDGITSLAQSVLLREAANGPLRVYVAYDPDSPSRVIDYEGLADVEYDPNPMPARRLLPDLEARPQRHLTFNPGGIFARAISPQFPSCYFTEVEEDGAHTCLRFDQVFANVGKGDLEVHFTVPNGSAATAHDAFQRIYWSDGADHFEDRPVGLVEFHRTHEHYHLTSLGLSRLWSVDANGEKAGASPIAQTNRKDALKVSQVRSGRKVSFCMVDTEIDAWGKKGVGPRTWKAPDCLSPVSKDNANSYFAQGITKGWRDIYEWYLPHQYIDVSGVPDGIYILETIADPENEIEEEDKTNNCVSIYIRLSGISLGSPAAQIVGPGPPCSQLR